MADRAIYHFWRAHLLVYAVLHARAIIQFCAHPSQIMGSGHDIVSADFGLSTRIDLSQLFLPSLPRVTATSRVNHRQHSLF